MGSQFQGLQAPALDLLDSGPVVRQQRKTCGGGCPPQSRVSNTRRPGQPKGTVIADFLQMGPISSLLLPHTYTIPLGIHQEINPGRGDVPTGHSIFCQA